MKWQPWNLNKVWFGNEDKLRAGASKLRPAGQLRPVTRPCFQPGLHCDRYTTAAQMLDDWILGISISNINCSYCISRQRCDDSVCNVWYDHPSSRCPFAWKSCVARREYKERRPDWSACWERLKEQPESTTESFWLFYGNKVRSGKGQNGQRAAVKIHLCQRWEMIRKKVSAWFWHETRDSISLIKGVSAWLSCSVMERRKSDIDASTLWNV